MVTSIDDEDRVNIGQTVLEDEMAELCKNSTQPEFHPIRTLIEPRWYHGAIFIFFLLLEIANSNDHSLQVCKPAHT